MQHIYTIGLEASAMEKLRERCPQLTPVPLEFTQRWLPTFTDYLQAEGSSPSLLLMGAGWSAHCPILELGRQLRKALPETEIVYFGSPQAGLERTKVLENGLTDYLDCNGDLGVLMRLLKRHFNCQADLDLRPIFVMDLRPGDRLEFETFLYLPVNRKYIKFTGAGAAIDERRLNKIKDRGQARVFVEAQDLSKFFRYAADRLQALHRRSGMKLSLTERRERLAATVRDLMTSLLDSSTESTYEKGKDMMSCCQGIISNFITNGRQDDWYDRILAAVGGDSDRFQQASAVSTLAALFALGVGLENPEDLAFAGLFADIGLTLLPIEISSKSEETLTAEEMEQYKQHPALTISYLQERKVPLKDTVLRAIEEHHESFLGRGYPKGLKGSELSVEGQILAFSVRFADLTRVLPGRTSHPPQGALEIIDQEGLIDPELMRHLRQLFPASAKPQEKQVGGRA